MSLKVLHCPTTVGGNPQGISRAERQLGVDSHSVAFCQNMFNYPCDEVLWQSNSPIKVQNKLRWSLLRRAWRDFDVIHYNFGTPILEWSPIDPASLTLRQQLSRKILSYRFSEQCERLMRWTKVIAVTYQGDDARQGDRSLRDLRICIAQEVGLDYYNPESDRAKRRTIELFTGYADLIYALNPDLLRVLPQGSKFMPYAHLDLTDWRYLEHPRSERPVVLHAPSHRGGKGTRFVLDAVSRLKSEDVPFDFVLIENMSNIEARKHYEKADLVVDQLLAGWYGGFAAEVMALGKPVICYMREEDLEFVPPEMRRELPIIDARPDSIYEVMKLWLTENKNRLAEQGLVSRRYVERWHDPVRIAQSLIDDYQRIHQRKHPKSFNASKN
jgi:glycosyltransferase involved in cell wall biosynthesis